MQRGGNGGLERFHHADKVVGVGAVEAVVSSLLLQHHPHLSHLIVVIVVVVVQMFLKQIEDDTDMWSTMDVLQLVAREFGDDKAVGCYLVEDVE